MTISAADCRQRRPGESFNRKGESANPEVLDSEYVAFLKDMGVKLDKDKSAKEAPYVPPMGDLSRSLQAPKTPLMLTNEGAAPGAASAQARALSSSQQTAGGMLQVSFNNEVC